MKAVRINASAGLDGLDLIDLPDPGRPGPGGIRVHVHASSLNYHDYGVARSGDPKFQGRIPLSDAGGWSRLRAKVSPISRSATRSCRASFPSGWTVQR